MLPSLSDEAEITADLPDILTELNRAKCVFQLRAITAVLGLDPLHHTPNNNPHRDDSTLTVGLEVPFHLSASSPEARQDHE